MVRKSIKLFGLTLFFILIFLFFSSSGQAEHRPLKLDLLIEEALQNSPEILASKKRWEVFKEKIPQARALPDPMLSLGIISLPTNFSFRDEDMTMKELSISQMFPFYGKRRLMGEMAEKEAEAVFKEIQERTNRIIKEVKTTYFELSYIYRSTEITQKNKEILESFVKIAETQYALGMGIQQDVMKAHIEVSKMADELIMLGQKRRGLEAKLIALLNRPPESSIEKAEEVSFKKIPFAIDELQKMAVEINPTLQAMKKMIEAKEKAYELAKKEYYPDLTFKFAYGQRDNGPEMKRRDMLTGMMEINIPIFYKSKQERKVAETKSEIQVIEAQYRAMKNEILFMITDMGSMIQRVERQLELYKSGIIPQASLQMNSAMSAYRVGKADFMTLLDSQMTLYRYELEYHQALIEYHKNLASLEAVVGRRFD
jgi:cobalt-zinc-cadmium efflux system outer membrane protein